MTCTSTGRAARGTAAALSPAWPYRPDSCPPLTSRKQTGVSGICSGLVVQFAEAPASRNCVQISIFSPHPQAPSLCQGVPCLCPAGLTERGEMGSIWRLAGADNACCFTRAGWGCGCQPLCTAQRQPDNNKLPCQPQEILSY